MRKYIFFALIFAAGIIFATRNTTTQIALCPAPVQEHIEGMLASCNKTNNDKLASKVTVEKIEFVKTENAPLNTHIVRKYWNVTYKIGQTLVTKRVCLPIENGQYCKVSSYNI